VLQRLGRRGARDDRDQKFLMRSVVAQRGASKRNKRNWKNVWAGDQGVTPQCVGYAWVHWLEDGPVTQVRARPPVLDPAVLYHEAQKVDEWEGEDYEGTSVRAGAKVLQAMGFINEYRWAFDLDTLVEAVLEYGPVVVGTNWYAGMDEPDREGIIHVRGSIRGGHAWEIRSVDRLQGFFGMKQSWGPGWGNRGFARISFKDVDRLLMEYGEACLASEVRLMPLGEAA